jgi:hypothetical protein
MLLTFNIWTENSYGQGRFQDTYSNLRIQVNDTNNEEVKSTIFWDKTPCRPLQVIQRTTWHYIPGDRTFHNHHFENLKSNIYLFNVYLARKLNKHRRYNHQRDQQNITK